jgi:HEAT repeat protein
MYRFVFLAVLLALATGCGKKKAEAEPEAGAGPGTSGQVSPADEAKAGRERIVNNLRGGRNDTRQATLDALADWTDDADLIAALVELLKDTTTAPRPVPGQITSAREAAAVALTRIGPKGEAALKDRGLNVLRDGLGDPNPTVREHTAYTLGQLGPAARPVAAAVQKLCTDPDPKVRGAAFDALRSTGCADVAGLAALLTNPDPETRRLAAELLTVQPEMPLDAVSSLVKALTDGDEFVRAAAAEGIGMIGPSAGVEAAKKLAAAIRGESPAEVPPMAPPLTISVVSYWRAIGKLGRAAVEPVGELVKHGNWVVRALAIRTLGELGTAAKGELPRIRDAIGDPFAAVALEAACAVCKLGDDPAPAVRVVTSALGSTNEQVPAAAIAAIARMGPAGKPLIPAALAKLADPSPYSRLAAVEFVRTLEPAEAEKTVPELAKLMTDPSPEVRRKVGEVFEALGPRAGPAAEAVGKKLPGETDTIARDQFVAALAAMGPAAKPAAPGLLPLLADTSNPLLLRVKAAETAAVADPTSADVSAALVKMAGDPEPAVRAAAAGAIGRLDPLPPPALAALVKMAQNDSRNEGRVGALRALVVAGPRAAAAKGELSSIAGGQNPWYALWAKVALASADGDAAKAAPAVRAGLTDKSGPVRVTAAEALLLVGGPTAADLPALTKLLREPSEVAKEAAARAIGPLGAAAKEAVPRLVELLADRSGTVRIAAAEALEKIGPAAAAAAVKLRGLAADPLVGPAARKALEKIEANPPKK